MYGGVKREVLCQAVKMNDMGDKGEWGKDGKEHWKEVGMKSQL